MMRRAIFAGVFGLGLVAAVAGQGPEGRTGSTAAILTIDGPIGPAVSSYIAGAHDEAVKSGARAVILEIDTPGGLDTSMRDIIRLILNSPIPVLTYVTPSGARAASAGTYILYASHVAAMSPATNLGAATPVPVGGGSPLPTPGTGDKSPESGGDGASDGGSADSSGNAPDDAPPAGDAMQNKILNDAVAYIRGLAERRGRNADWAEKAVREGVSLTANKALEHNVIDIVASDIGDLLAQADGREVDTPAGAITLKTSNLALERFEPDWRDDLLSVITNPTIAYVLMLVGIYGLLLEGYNPGAILPGTVGAISLLLALFAFQVLPVNFVGLGLMALGVALMIAEALAPSFGVLGFGGVAAFVMGSVLLMDTDIPGYGVNIGIIVAIAVGASVLMLLTLYLLKRSRETAVVTGEGQLVGHTVVGYDDEWVRYGDEFWRYRSDTPLAPGQRATITALDGLVVIVEPQADSRFADDKPTEAST